MSESSCAETLALFLSAGQDMFSYFSANAAVQRYVVIPMYLSDTLLLGVNEEHLVGPIGIQDQMSTKQNKVHDMQ